MTKQQIKARFTEIQKILKYQRQFLLTPEQAWEKISEIVRADEIAEKTTNPTSVKCERCQTHFTAVIQPYPSELRPTHLYDKDGDKYIECPTCKVRYFHYNKGTDLPDLEEPHKTGWHADRPLTINN